MHAEAHDDDDELADLEGCQAEGREFVKLLIFKQYNSSARRNPGAALENRLDTLIALYRFQCQLLASEVSLFAYLTRSS